MPWNPEMFELSNITPHWKGRLIARLEAPLTAGFAKLKQQCVGAPCLGFCMTTNFDYGDMWDNIPFIHAYKTRQEAQADLAEKLIELEGKILAKHPKWTMVSETARAYEVLPATGSIVPGKFPTQIMARKYMPNYPEESIYARMYLVQTTAAEAALDQLLGMDGIASEVIDYIKKMGEAD